MGSDYSQVLKEVDILMNVTLLKDFLSGLTSVVNRRLHTIWESSWVVW